ncbi:homoserine dehydrogenase [Tetragenococcus halophilus]|uniref:homoserine dehydrogenase n=1 Tax=Tetragenococcus halophilus TaxID=51669 RepID=UPI001F3F6FD4|nr:homoserine dehydrogenase [Tetragenococcus halophilus]MCF1684377.1 homoserine dehydrogenase [Tetragenococcus halophilus]
MKKQVNIAVLGLGVVANGLVKNLITAEEKIKQQTGLSISIAKVLVRSKEKKQGLAQKYQLTLTTEVEDILADPTIDIVVELIGGIDSAKEWITLALQRKKHVVTANKDLIARFGNELTAIAKANDVSLFYEASVAGGIPILRNLNTSFMTDEITAIQGILNGTSNFMLTQMNEAGLTYGEALESAQVSGFAESDPTNDVDGWDAAYKLIILVRLALNQDLALDDLSVKGIGEITQVDNFYAHDFGYQIKPLAHAQLIDEGIYAAVEPVLIPQTHPFAFVKNEMNGVFIESNVIGNSLLYGPGAGASPTAESVLADILTIAKNMNNKQQAFQMSSSNLPSGKLHKEGLTNYYFLLTDCAIDLTVFLEKQHIRPISLKQQENKEAAFISNKLTVEQKHDLIDKLQEISHVKQILSVWED